MFGADSQAHPLALAVFCCCQPRCLRLQEAGSKLGLLMQDMLLDTFPELVHLDSGRRCPSRESREVARKARKSSSR